MSAIFSSYKGDLQERLRKLSLRTNCPTRQENGQRYLGPPSNWNEKAPTNAEIFLSKLPADCYEDEIYDFCAQFGKIYLIRLMINFENENRGFCFVTFSTSKEANNAVTVVPQTPLRKGHYVHAEISLNNCTLKMYGLDFGWSDENLEEEIRSNTKDVVNVTIKRNLCQRTLMAILHFDTHQKAAIARRKLSQIANSRWGQNVKVFLWSKKLQNKCPNKEELTPEKAAPSKKSNRYNGSSFVFEKERKRSNEFDSMYCDNEEDNTDDLFQFPEKVTNTRAPTSPLSTHRQWSPVAQSTIENNIHDMNANNHFYSSQENFMESPYDLFYHPRSSPLTTLLNDQFGSPPSRSATENLYDFSFGISKEMSPGGGSSEYDSLTDTDGYGFDTFTSHNKDVNFFSDADSISSLEMPENQIELILKEALEAMALNGLNDYQY